MHARRYLGLLGAAAMACGCAAKAVVPPLDAARDDGAPPLDATRLAADAPGPTDASMRADAGDTPLEPDAAPVDVFDPPGECAGWTVGPTTELTHGGAVDLPAALALAPDGVWVAYESTGTTSVATWIQRVGADGSVVAPPQRLSDAPASSALGVGGLAVRDDGTGAVVLDSDLGGCRFVALDATGAPSAAPVAANARRCADLRATAEGYSSLVAAPLTTTGGLLALARLDRAGGALAPDVTLAMEANTIDAVARVALPADAFLLAWNVPATTRLFTQRFDATGRAASALPTATPVFGEIAGRLVAAATALGALAAWNRFDSATRGATVAVRAFDPSGAGLGPTQVVPGATSGRSANLALATARGDAVLAWTEADATTFDVVIHAVALSPLGAPRGPSFVVGRFGHDSSGPTYPRAIATPAGVLLVYFATPVGLASPRLYATLLQCATR